MQKLGNNLSKWLMNGEKNQVFFGREGGLTPKFPEIYLLHILHCSLPTPSSGPRYLYHHIKSDGKCSLEMKRKGDSQEVLQQKQGDSTTSRSLYVIYVREIKQDSGLQFCELFTFFGYTEKHSVYCRTRQLNQTDTEVQHTIQSKQVNRSAVSYELIWTGRMISALWPKFFIWEYETWLIVSKCNLNFASSSHHTKFTFSKKTQECMGPCETQVLHSGLYRVLHSPSFHRLFKQTHFPQFSFYSGEGIQFLYPEN